MSLRNLTEEDIKEVFRKVLTKVDNNVKEIDKCLKVQDIVKTKDGYCFGYYNGFEHKVCVINDNNVYVSSETDEDNKYLTKYLKQAIQEVLENKYSIEV